MPATPRCRASATRPSYVQLRILRNAAAGRLLDEGRACTQSAAAGWGCSITSCVRRGWLDRAHQLTPAGDALVSERKES